MKINDPIDMPICLCVSCGEPNDAATGVDTADKPKPGDATVCLSCGHVMAFAEDLTLREPTEEEAKDFATNPVLLTLRKAISMLRQKNMERWQAAPPKH